jgi:hypothetical protein
MILREKLRRKKIWIQNISTLPVAPKGCPRAMAPPLTLTLLGSSPNFFLE